jgi:hypothetical protein
MVVEAVVELEAVLPELEELVHAASRNVVAMPRIRPAERSLFTTGSP